MIRIKSPAVFVRVAKRVIASLQDSKVAAEALTPDTPNADCVANELKALVQKDLSDFVTAVDSMEDDLAITIGDDDIQSRTTEIMKSGRLVLTILAPFTIPKPEPLHTVTLSANELNATVSGPNSQPSLPKLRVPTFSGRISDWASFYAQFTSLVHDNALLQPIQKFQFLLTCLDPSSAKLISHLALTEANYDLALDLLVKRYDNPRRVISYHASRILDLPEISANSAELLYKFLDEFNVSFNALKVTQELNECDAILTTFLLSKFNQHLTTKFEEQRGISTPFPTVTEVIEFLTKQASQLANANMLHPKTPKSAIKTRRAKSPARPMALVSDPAPFKTSLCLFCSKQHQLANCEPFLKKSANERYNWVKSQDRCFNCLGKHNRQACRSKRLCRHCSRNHHSLLHFGSTKSPSSARPKDHSTTGGQSTRSHITSDATSSVASTLSSTNAPGVTSLLAQSQDASTILLATCLVRLEVSPSDYIVVRAILDTGAGASFITERCTDLLACSRRRVSTQVHGLASAQTPAKGLCHLTIAKVGGQKVISQHPFLIVPSIVNKVPRLKVSSAVRQAANHLTLADPTFDTPGPVSLLLGADVVASLFSCGPAVPLGPNLPLAFPTPFGYVIMGSAPTSQPSSTAVSGSTTPHAPTAVEALTALPAENLNDLVERFWEMEEPPSCKASPSPEDQLCETFFTNTTTRVENGRYQVRLPFLPEPPSELGESFQGAYARFMALERRFVLDPIFKAQYVEFMVDYIKQGHMQLANGPTKYFIPHHGIFKTHGDTKKIRVVFNASAPTTSGVSLNDLLYSGPKLQPLLSDIITLFRKYLFAFSCDIKHMFRQISIHPDDWPYQCILWRENPNQPLQKFYLTTVTYGTRSAPYLALRSLAQLVIDEGAAFPLAANALSNNVFVDDIVVGANTLSSALLLRNQMISLLGRGNFVLRKWAANHSDLISDLPRDHLLELSDDASSSLLGTIWNTASDSFNINTNISSDLTGVISKRMVLSGIAQIFDPCGWLAPCVMIAKNFLQQLWCLPLSWDSPLDDNTSLEWRCIVKSLPVLSTRKIPRTMFSRPIDKCALHGFCDASQKGYAAVLYLSSGLGDEPPALLAAKTRVAPLKRQTIPRLELCAAHLLSVLVAHYISLLSPHYNITTIWLWSDSQIVLNWLNIDTYKLKTFVANRVAQILENTSAVCWRYVPSVDNPADLASRGVKAQELLNSPLWWHGPPWLSTPSSWPSMPTSASGSFSSDELEYNASNSFQILLATTDSSEENLFKYFSKWSRLFSVVRRILALSPRFKGNLKPDRDSVLRAICFYVQQSAFATELALMRQHKPLVRGLQRLTPFIDKYGLIRVGGRLEHSNVLVKHPILLPKSHPAVDMLIDFYHVAHLHAGVSYTQYQLAQEFWILSSRQAVRSRIFKCITCFRAKPVQASPLMGQLPAPRVNPSPPFTHTGMDFAGPFLSKSSSLRKAPLIKAYLCIFICLATKAIHLELATDLSANAFIDVLLRFISRRGSPSHLYSDCGTNFVGASAILNRQVLKFLNDSTTSTLIKEFCLLKGIAFNFNPPSAPHQGGLWERAVRSTKYHLVRVLNGQSPTLATLTTLIIRIEGILNSRPISALSNDPLDVSALTPAHFLIGRPLTFLPEPEAPYVKATPRHLLWIYSLTQSFWRQWKVEYLPTLQTRSKWCQRTPNLEPGDLVVLDEPNTPPCTWPMARVTRVFPGLDGVVRKAEIKTSSGCYTRPATKLFRLPIYDQ